MRRKGRIDGRLLQHELNLHLITVELNWFGGGSAKLLLYRVRSLVQYVHVIQLAVVRKLQIEIVP